MTPAELITRNFRDLLADNFGATLSVYSLLIEALDGEPHVAPASGIAVNIAVSGQRAEPLPLYDFTLTAALAVAVDEDKGATLFAQNYEAIWNACDWLALEDNCAALGADNIFLVDGFQLAASNAPAFLDDESGGTWQVSFSAKITGRAIAAATPTANEDV